MTGAGVVIAGCSTAGLQVATSLRELGYADRILLVGDEPYPAYHRPPLSKAYLMGQTDESRLQMRPQAFYTEKNIDVLLGRSVVAVDRVHHRVAFDDDTATDYEHFVFAVGARNRPLPVPGTDLDGVFHLRTLADAQMLKARMTQARHAVVIGAGFIGLEFAAVAAKRGLDITVIDVAARPMARAVSAATSKVFADAHGRSGIRLLFNTQTMRLLGEGDRVRAVETVEGDVIPADLVLVGIGVQPNVEVAAACNLEVQNGIVVDKRMCTADPAISAVGDCAAHPNAFADGAVVRLESVQNAGDQARVVAARIAGRPVDYEAVPWFWSDQGDLKLQIAGLTMGHDRTVVRGDVDKPACTVFCFRGERLLGIETVNRPADHMAARKIIGLHLPLTPAMAVDEGLDLKQLIAQAAAHG